MKKTWLQSDQATGFILLGCAVLSLILANSPIQQWIHLFWSLPIANHTLTHWISDGLMTLFFLLVGLEIKRERLQGDLSSTKKATLPLLAALGGILVPASLYLALNHGLPSRVGWGIPIATDIAFALAILSLLGSRIPTSIKVFLTAFAIVDDLCAVAIIALFYTHQLSLIYLSASILLFLILIMFNRIKVHALFPYLALGVLLWGTLLKSGLHPTIAGVAVAFCIPLRTSNSPLLRLEHALTKPVYYGVLPLFILANTAISFASIPTQTLLHPLSTGIILGLFIGKPLGILTSCWLAIRLKIAHLPTKATWKHMAGTACLGGIGFTMSIFIALLSFSEPRIQDTAKLAILAGSVASGIVGYYLLKARSAL